MGCDDRGGLNGHVLPHDQEKDTRLILDFILSTVGAIRRSHAALPYGMFLTRVFTRGQLLIDRYRKDKKCPKTIIKTFSTMGLKLQD